MTERKYVVVVEEGDSDEFERRCAELYQDGYTLSSSSIGFVQSEAYDFCSVFQAIFVDAKRRDIPMQKFTETRWRIE